MRWLRLAFAALTTLGVQAVGAHATAFPLVDLNHDGVVEYWEARRAYPRLAEVHFRRCDLNRDGVIDRREFPQLDNFYTVMYRIP